MQQSSHVIANAHIKQTNGLPKGINILNTPSSGLWATEPLSLRVSGSAAKSHSPACVCCKAISPFSGGAQHPQSRDWKRLQRSARSQNDWTNPCFLIPLLSTETHFSSLCSWRILQLLLSDLIYWPGIVNCGLLPLRLGFELPEQLRFAKLNE